MTKAGSASLKFFNLLIRIMGTLGVISVSYGIVTAVEFSAQNGVRGSFVEAGSVKMSGIQSLYAIGKAIMIIDGAENALLATDIGEKRRQNIYSQFDEAKRSLDESINAYEGLHLSPEESRLWEDFIRALQRWGKDHERFVELAGKHDKNGTAETYRKMTTQALDVNPASFSAAVSLLDAIIETGLGGREEKSESSETAAPYYKEYIVQAVAVGGIILAAALIVALVNRTRRPRRRFPMGRRRLTLDVDTHRNVFSSMGSAMSKDESR